MSPPPPKRHQRRHALALHVAARLSESALVDAALDRVSGRRSRSGPASGDAPHAPTPQRGPSSSSSSVTAAALLRSGPGAPAVDGAPTVRHYAAAYRSGQTTPVEVAEAFLRAAHDSEAVVPPLRIFISQHDDDVRAQAAASAARHAAGKPLSLLDGVPVAVKDEIDQAGYITTQGTAMASRAAVAAGDCEAVARLRALGAVLVGKANMHELGAGPLGRNVVFGSCRNPWDLTRFPGGSSSGSAAAVAAGLVPLSVGCDGGGSIRIPASLCGVVGLKPTFGRVPQVGTTPPVAFSVTHIGPLGQSVDDVALGYAALAGPDARDRATLSQPAVSLSSASGRLQGLRVGVLARWFEAADPDVAVACARALSLLEARGAVLVDIDDVDGIDNGLQSLVLSIGTELQHNAFMNERSERRALAPDTRVGLALARHLGPRLYARAQRARAALSARVEGVLGRVDVLASPTTLSTAPPFTPTPTLGDLRVTTRLMRTTALANVTGQPALSLPVGFDGRGLPIGLQLLSRAYDEALLLRVGGHVEAALLSTLRGRRPRHSFRVLPD